MQEYVLDLIARHRQQPVLDDANILLLHFIGSFDRDLVGRFKRTAQYVPDDFILLRRLLSLFRGILTTPNILTEVSNLASRIQDPLRTHVFESFRDRIQVLDERFVPSAEASRQDEFTRLGLTDVVLARIAAKQFLVLTDDLNLYLCLEQHGVDVLNFSHIRQFS